MRKAFTNLAFSACLQEAEAEAKRAAAEAAAAEKAAKHRADWGWGAVTAVAGAVVGGAAVAAVWWLRMRRR